MRLIGLLMWTVAIALIVVPQISAAAEVIVGEILIEANALHPEVLMTEPEHRVLFTNRSGHSVRIQFIMKNPNGEKHHIVQVPEQIWAIFHQMGRHPFVVHFGDRAVPDLYGAVEIVGDPYGRPDPLVCSGITVMGACLER
jgi:hypothetical protein